MFRPALIALACAVSGPVNAQSANRFDLVCDITQQVLGGEREVEPRFSQMRLRIDLERKVWCADECKNVNDVASATSAEIVLANPLTDGMRINRVSGTLDTTPSRRFGLLWTFSGQCRRAPYTAIPRQIF